MALGCHRERNMRWFYNMKISAKLLVSSFVMAAIAGVVGYVGISQMSTITTADTKMYEVMTVPISQLGDISRKFQQLRTTIRDTLLADTKEERDKCVNNMHDFIQQMTDLDADYVKA
jgi:methyl-accepting chemotaxis protein